MDLQVFLPQLVLGLNNGAFYALLSLGLAVIFGLLNVINFAHGAQFMLGAYVALLANRFFGVSYFTALFLSPILVGLLGIILERFFLRRIAKLDPLYSLLLTFGIAIALEGMFINFFGVSGEAYDGKPEILEGALNLGFMFLPTYRAWVIILSLVICLITWVLIEKTKLGSYLRAGTEKPELLQSFGVNVPLMVTLTYGYGVALAALAGVMAAPMLSVNPKMGSELIIVVFAVVVIGGMGSIGGSILTGFALGIIEGFTKVIYPEASNTVIFIIMALVLLFRPTGLFGREK